jgi:predicted RNase H-like HicB family nuclease
MLTDYIHAAMGLARYEVLEDGATYGEIPGLDGVLATADTLEGCRAELQAVLEEWIILGLRLGHSFPAVSGVELKAVVVA